MAHSTAEQRRNARLERIGANRPPQQAPMDTPKQHLAARLVESGAMSRNPYAGEAALNAPIRSVATTLSDCAEWLRMQDRAIVFGIRTPEDALTLYRWHLNNPDQDSDIEWWPARRVVELIGYNPLNATGHIPTSIKD